MTALTQARTSNATLGANATTWNPTMTWNVNNAIAAGETTIWIATLAMDGNPTITEDSGAGWTKLGQQSDATNAVTGAMFILVTTGAYAASAKPALSFTFSASEQGTLRISAYKSTLAGAGIANLISAAAHGSSTNSDPPSVTNTTGAAQDATFVTMRAGDAAVTPSAGPAGYAVGHTAGGTGGATVSSGIKQTAAWANAAVENPGTFTVNTEQWVCWTLAAYEVPGPLVVSPGISATTAENVTLLPKHTLTVASAASASTAANVTLTFPGVITLTVQPANSITLSHGFGLGAEMVLDGDMSSTTNWFGSDAAVTLVGGRLRVTATGAGAPNASQTIFGFENTHQYRITGEQYLGNTADKARITGTATVFFVLDHATYGSPVSYDFRATDASSGIILTLGVASAGAWGATPDYAEFDNISIKPIDAIILSPKTTLAVQAAASATTAENVVLGGLGVALTVQGAASATTAGNVTITPRHSLSVQPTSSLTQSGRWPVLGAEIIVNGSFNTGASWTTGAGTAINGGQANAVAEAASAVSQPIQLIDGRLYEAVFTVVGYVSGSIQFLVQIGSPAWPTGAVRSANGTYTEQFVADSGASGTVHLIANAVFTGNLDNFSIKPADVTGDVILTPHAGVVVQPAASATTSANVTLSPKTPLTVASAASASTAANVTITPRTALTVQSAASATMAANVLISFGWDLIVQPAVSPTTSATPLITPRWSLFPADAASATTTDSPVIIYSFVIAVLEGNEAPVFYPELLQHEQQVWPSSYVVV